MTDAYELLVSLCGECADCADVILRAAGQHLLLPFHRMRLRDPEEASYLLRLASSRGRKDVVSLVLDESPCLAGKIGGDCLVSAFRAGHYSLGYLLVQRGANIDAAEGEPLRLAVERKRAEDVDRLLGLGADLTIAHLNQMCADLDEDILLVTLERLGPDMHIPWGVVLSEVVARRAVASLGILLGGGVQPMRYPDVLSCAVGDGDISVLQMLLEFSDTSYPGSYDTLMDLMDKCALMRDKDMQDMILPHAKRAIGEHFRHIGLAL